MDFLDKILPYLLNTLPVWCIAIVGLVYYSTRFYYNNYKPTKKDVDTLKKDIGEIKTNIIRFNYEIGQVKSFLMSKHKLNYDTFSMKNSPRKLNSNGLKLFADARCQDFLDANKDELLKAIEDAKPQTALDVEQWANMVCYDATNKPIFNKLKDFVYSSPSIEVIDKEGNTKSYDVTLQDIVFILSLPLRDMYLELHPEIKPED